MTNPNTLERWRPHPIVYLHCLLAIVLPGIACSWGVSLLIARWSQPESPVKTAILGMGLFVVVLCLALRRCSSPELSAFRGLLLLTGYMTIGVGSFALLFVIQAVAFAMVAIIAIGLVSLFRNDTTYARKQFENSWTSIGGIGCTSKLGLWGRVTGVVKSR
jgi:thiamine transporter ThiT